MLSTFSPYLNPIENFDNNIKDSNYSKFGHDRNHCIGISMNIKKLEKSLYDVDYENDVNQSENTPVGFDG